MIQKFLFQKIFDLVKQPHLSDFPFYLRDNPIRKIRTYLGSLETLYDKDRKIYYKKTHTL